MRYVLDASAVVEVTGTRFFQIPLCRQFFTSSVLFVAVYSLPCRFVFPAILFAWHTRLLFQPRQFSFGQLGRVGGRDLDTALRHARHTVKKLGRNFAFDDPFAACIAHGSTPSEKRPGTGLPVFSHQTSRKSNSALVSCTLLSSPAQRDDTPGHQARDTTIRAGKCLVLLLLGDRLLTTASFPLPVLGR